MNRLKQYWSCWISVTPVLMLALIILGGCLGKTTVRNTYYISPRKNSVFIAPPVNHTGYHSLNDRIHSRLQTYFSSQTRFNVIGNVEDSDLYVLLYLYDYVTRDVSDYGWVNRKIMIRAGLFVSDSKYQNQKDDQEQLGRYYYKNFPLEVEVLDYVELGNSRLTEERLENLAIDRMAISVHELMLTGKLPTSYPNR